MKLPDPVLVACYLVLQLLQLVLQGLNSADLLLAFLLRVGDIFVEQVSLPFLLLDLFSIFVNGFLLGFIGFRYNLQFGLQGFLRAIILFLSRPSLADLPFVYFQELLVLCAELLQFFDLCDNGIQLDLLVLPLVRFVRLGSLVPV